MKSGRWVIKTVILMVTVMFYAPCFGAIDNSPPASTVKLIFIHHSTGGNWLADANSDQPYGGLGTALMNNNYYVSATNYGWGPNSVGDRTDIPDWPEWFTSSNSSTILPALYSETGQNVGGFGSWSCLGTDPGGENEIIMFKSCFPNSDLYGSPTDEAGSTLNEQYTVSNAKAVYNNLLTYFRTRTDKLFVVITAPPQNENDYSSDFQTAAERSANARAFNNWLVNDWLDGYEYNNVAVFDYFNVLTATDNHHRWYNNAVQHVTNTSYNYSAYPADTWDSHPSSTGHQKATAEFVDLLNYYYNTWQSDSQKPDDDDWVDINGTVTYDGTPVCAMVLANGQYMFTCSGDGSFNLNVPLDPNGQITVFSFCSGLAPYKQIINPADGTDMQINLASGEGGTGMDVSYTVQTISSSRVRLSGTITYNGSPVCAMALANGQYMFTCSGDGSFSLDVPLDTNGEITLFGFCSGLPPYKYIITASEINFSDDSDGDSSELLQTTDFQYVGAFRLPGSEDRPLTFEYGGNAMTFNPAGDSTGPFDGFPGSLFIMGHDRMPYGDLPNGNQVAEIDIPLPVNSSNIDELNYGQFIQNFTDISAGYFPTLDEIPRVGMAYLDHSATGPKIHIGWGAHFQHPPADVASHGWFDPDLSSPDMQGFWYIGDQNLYSVNGYLFEIPSSWADQNASGRYLAAGRFRDGGMSGMGPALFAYRPWTDSAGTPAANDAVLDETPLLLYANAENTNDVTTNVLTGYQHPDEWEGGAWVTTSSGKNAVLFAGTKSEGDKYWYGYINPAGPEYPCVDAEVSLEDTLTCRMADGSSCPTEDFSGCCEEGVDCPTSRGWWSSEFSAWFLLYDPDDLAQVANGTMQPWEPQPYAHLDFDAHLFHDPDGVNAYDGGTGIQRRYRIGAVAYDRTNDLLYVVEHFADSAKPVIHVWWLGSDTTQ